MDKSAQVKFHKSLRGRLVLFGVLPTILLLVGIVSYEASTQYSLARSYNESLLRSMAVEAAKEIERTNNRAVMAAQVMAMAQEHGLFGSREDTSQYARRVLEFYPEFTGAYFGYEPNADQDDGAYFASEAGSQMIETMDSTGRFLPYWYRSHDDSKIILIEPLVDMETSLYYSGIKKKYEETGGRYIVTEPYIYEGKMIVEQTSPIVINGKFAGIAGVDRALTDLVGFLSMIKEQNGVDIFLISRTGRFIAVTIGDLYNLETKGIQETPYRDLFTPLYDNRHEQDLVLSADPLDEQNNYYYASAPVPTGDWLVVIRKAESEVIGPIQTVVFNTLGIAAIGLFVVLLVLLWTTASATRRLRNAVAAADLMASGALPGDTELEIGAEDEIGLMNRSFNRVMQAFRDITRVSVAVADGDFSQQVTPRSEDDELAHAINRMTTRRKEAEEELRNVTQETEQQHRTSNALNELNEVLRSEHSLQPLCEKAVNFIGRFLSLPMAGLFVRGESNLLEWQAGFACPADYHPGTHAVGEGLVGQAAKDMQPIYTTNPDSDYLVQMGFADVQPSQLLFYPLVLGEECIGVLELALLKPLDKFETRWLEQTVNSIAVSVRLALDIARRKQAEEATQKARTAAENANRAKSTFLANMSHELRTPMNAILGYSEMLMEEAEDIGQDDFVSDLKKINQAGNHLLSLINDVLDLSKIESGKMEAFAEDFDVGALIDHVVGTVQPLMSKNNNQLKIERGEQLGHAHQDLTKLRQSMMNLLSNAAKFTHEGTITLRADRKLQADGEWLTFSVTDTGIGIPADKLEHVFEEFSQADNSTTRDYGGTGLGLPISRRFCQMLGGDLTVRSNAGEGSVFTMQIPVRLPGTDTGTPVETAPVMTDAELEAMRISGAGRTVLVIDDDPEALDIVERFLRKDGFEVVTAGSGEEGLRLAHKLQPTAITLDVMMPDMDGWSVLRALKADPVLQNVPVVMLTMVDDKSKGYSLGATDYLTKPVDRSQLHNALTRFCTPGEPCSVLLVEDDVATREIMVRTLEEADWLVSEAGNGREALDQLTREKPLVILLDLMMPVMDGFDFLIEMRANAQWQDIPVIVLTAKDLTEEDRRILSGRVEQIVEKGACPHEQVVNLIRKAIDHTPHAGKVAAPAQ